MIKKYQSFFESITIKLSFDQAFKNFCENLTECEKYLSENSDSMSYDSYSYVAQENKGDIDPELDFREIDKYMSKVGWDLKIVKQLTDGVSDFATKIERAQISQTAAVDYYLYKITNKEFPLQGYKWDLGDMDSPDPELNEFIIKFSYGWHKTRYGKLAILQNMKSIKEFLTISFKNLSECIFIELSNLYSLDYTQTQKEKILKNFFLEKDINEIYIDSENLFSELKELNPTLSSLYSNSKHNTPMPKDKLISLTQDEFDNIIVNMLLKSELRSRVITSGDIKVNL